VAHLSSWGDTELIRVSNKFCCYLYCLWELHDDRFIDNPRGFFFALCYTYIVAWDTSVGICYELDGPGIESRALRDFSHRSRPPLEPTQPPV
jgi:hypothetical protein